MSLDVHVVADSVAVGYRNSSGRKVQEFIWAQTEVRQGIGTESCTRIGLARGRYVADSPSNTARTAPLPGVEIARGRALFPRGWHVEGASRHFPMMRYQQSAQALDADDLTLAAFMQWLDDSIEALVNPLVMIVCEILAQDVAQLIFRGENQVIETLLSHGPDESVCVGKHLRPVTA